MEGLFASYVSLREAYEGLISPHAGEHLSYDQVREDIVRGRLRAVRIRRRWHVDPADVQRYLTATIRCNTAAA